MLNVELKQVPNISFAVEGSMNCVGKEMPPGMTGEECVEYLRKRIADGHLGVMEHIIYQFKIKDISRAALQELVRHRMASYLVLSSRWALKKILPGVKVKDIMYRTGDKEVDALNHSHLEAVVEVSKDIPNDIMKYALPEALYTTVFMTINGSSLRNFFEKRWSKMALKEMRDLSLCLFYELPKLHWPLFQDAMNFPHFE